MAPAGRKTGPCLLSLVAVVTAFEPATAVRLTVPDNIAGAQRAFGSDEFNRLTRAPDTARRSHLVHLSAHSSLLRSWRGDETFRASLALARRHGDRPNEADALNALGLIARRCGRFGQAIDYYNQVLTLYRALDNPFGESETLENMGAAQLAAGMSDKAGTAWLRALTICRHQHRATDAERIRTKLAQAR